MALKSSGFGRATDDPDEARIILGKILEDIKAGRMPTKKAKPKRQRGDETRLGPMIDRFIKDNPGREDPKSIGGKENLLKRARQEFGSERALSSIEPHHLEKWVGKLEAKFSNSTILKHLYALSSVYRYAITLGTYVAVGGKHPVQRMYRKPPLRIGRTKSKKAEVA